jgi:hypothetical protein
VKPDVFSSPAQRRAAARLADALDGRGDASAADLAPLVGVATALRRAAPAPRPSADFSATLRARLVQEAADRPVTAAVPAPRRAAEVPTPRPRRVRQVVATTAVAALVGGAGAAVASTAAMPGDTLYGLKRGLESVQLSIAGSDLAKGREHLERADARLGEAEDLAAGAAVTADERAHIRDALAEMDADVRAGSDLLTGVYRDTGDTQALAVLDRFAVEQQRRLDALLDRLAAIDPALAAQAEETASLLATLHAEVLALTGGITSATSSRPLPGAARDPRSAGDGWAVSRINDDVTRSGGADLPSSSADGADAAPSAPAASEPDVLGGLTGGSEDVTDLDVGEVPATVAPSVGGNGVTLVPVPSVRPTLPAATLPVEPPDPLEPGAPLVDAPCVPAAPLTDC